MNEQLRFYIALNGSLKIMRGRSGSMSTLAEHFTGQTLECLTGCRERPEVVFAAVAFDGGYRTQDGGQTWEKVLDGDVRTFTVDPHDERVVYAGIGPVRLFRSETVVAGGSLWTVFFSCLTRSSQSGLFRGSTEAFNTPMCAISSFIPTIRISSSFYWSTEEWFSVGTAVKRGQMRAPESRILTCTF